MIAVATVVDEDSLKGIYGKEHVNVIFVCQRRRRKVHTTRPRSRRHRHGGRSEDVGQIQKKPGS